MSSGKKSFFQKCREFIGSSKKGKLCYFNMKKGKLVYVFSNKIAWVYTCKIAMPMCNDLFTSSLWFRIFRMLLQIFLVLELYSFFFIVNQMLKRGFSAIVAPSHRSDDDADFAKPLSTKVPQAKRASSASSTASGPSTRKSMLPTNRTSSGKPPTIGCLNSWHILDSQEIISICNQNHILC